MDGPRTEVGPRAELIGTTIRDARKIAGLTQVQVAELAGISDATLRDIEHGSGSPSLRAVLETLDVLGLRLEVTQ
ncbi:DNA-binding transcriptional repressor PuuR [Corynebacterium glaucum]|uniref:DNA-binding transcriptional repressor PuuR n=1 Tax=Corynebacterium glaucum TaxID=187491 RepID=A0A1Q2HZU9_9CORY|nr:helix-turn-helix domain-containing protein [Corynebacterium glaucum]AQQ16354.1 DNA-binding transcriptional repressor PuuR [Corynebacterium glaucum]